MMSPSVVPSDACMWARLTPAAIAFASASALVAALLAEYVFDIVGCTLCLYQRIPDAATTILAVLALMTSPSADRRRLLSAVCALLFAAGSAIAIYQVGSQQGWWAEPSVCAAALPSGDALLDLRSARPSRPACSEVDWSLFGLSLAALNAVYSGALAAACLFMMRSGAMSPPANSAPK
jgi:disulfide bond formation protein DsbB